MKTKIVWLFLFLILVALAWKEPFKLTNSIANLDPNPDTLYYSIPAWNFVHGWGFKMMAYGKEIVQGVPPLYGIYLIPFFAAFADVRSFYFANLILMAGTIYMFLLIAKRIYKDFKIVVLLGFILVTNFYVYNLPQLLMAENPLLLLTLVGLYLLLLPISIKNLILIAICCILLWLTKMSAFPVIVVMLFWTVVNLMTSGFYKKLNKNILRGLIWGGIGILGLIIVKVVMPNLEMLLKGTIFFSVDFAKQYLPYYLSQFLGINGRYLGSGNQQIESIISVFSIIGLVMGLLKKEYRKMVLVGLSLILSVVVFHSFMYYPEGRYISTVIPIFIIFAGVIPSVLPNKIRWLGILFIIGLYLGIRVNVNGFYERKVTTLKRQLMNNRLQDFDTAWKYRAVEDMNKVFSNKEEVYVATYIQPFYLWFFADKNINYLPISRRQDFSERFYDQQVIPLDIEIADYIKKLLMDGKEVYVSDYNSKAVKHWNEDYEKLMKNFKVTEVTRGCYDWCNIYKLDLLK